jgi:hypothetical protein
MSYHPSHRYVIEYLIANGCPRHVDGANGGANEENNIDHENVLNE